MTNLWAPSTDADVVSTPTASLQLPDLKTGEMLIVWAVRSWVAHIKANKCPRPCLERGLATGDVEGVLDPLDRIMRIIASAATSQRDVRCPTTREIGDGERAILQALALWQSGRNIEAHGATLDWLAPAAARIAAQSFKELSETLHNQRLIIPMRPDYEPMLTMDQFQRMHAGAPGVVH